MAAVSGQGTTFNLPNFVGSLFNLSPYDTPFTAAIGGMHGGVPTASKEIAWQTEDNTAAAQPAIVEGADPAYEERTRTEVTNVTQIFQYGVEVSYTKRAAVGNLGVPGTAPTFAILGDQPVQDELQHQLMLKQQRAARDVEFSFLQGAYQSPANNATGRKTRGILAAISTNATAAGAVALSKSLIDSTLQSMYTNGAPLTQPVVFVNGFQKQQFSGIYGYAPMSRNVGGVNIQTVETDFGSLGIVLDRFVPTDTVLFADLSVIRPRFLSIPEKGLFFLEPLAHTGASWKYQLYGEIGLEYGPEAWHGKITGLTTA